MIQEVLPENTSRNKAFDLWMKAPNPMLTVMKKLDVTPLVKYSKKNKLKFNMLMDYCIIQAAVSIPEFFILPVENKLFEYDTLAVNTIVKNKKGGISSCDIPLANNLKDFNKEYLKRTRYCQENCIDSDLLDSMVIGTSAVTNTVLDGIVGMNSGIFNNPFVFWSKYEKKFFRFFLHVSFQFHHVQMDGEQAGQFLENLQNQINTFC